LVLKLRGGGFVEETSFVDISNTSRKKEQVVGSGGPDYL
jgi:hypothetical protein